MMSVRETARCVFGEPALARGADGRVIKTAEVSDLAGRKEAQATLIMEAVRSDVALFRRLISLTAQGHSDDDFLALVEDAVRDSCALGPISVSGRILACRRALAWATVNTSIARYYFKEVGSEAMSDADWIEAFRLNLMEHHQADIQSRTTEQTQTENPIP